MITSAVREIVVVFSFCKLTTLNIAFVLINLLLAKKRGDKMYHTLTVKQTNNKNIQVNLHLNVAETSWLACV